MKIIVIPQDGREPIREVEAEGDALTISNFRGFTNIHWFERVNTRALHDLELVAVVDEEGLMKSSHTANVRGMLLAQYPGGPLVGDMMILRQAVGDDGGMDLVSVREGDLTKVKTAIDEAAAQRQH